MISFSTKAPPLTSKACVGFLPIPILLFAKSLHNNESPTGILANTTKFPILSLKVNCNSYSLVATKLLPVITPVIVKLPLPTFLVNVIPVLVVQDVAPLILYCIDTCSTVLLVAKPDQFIYRPTIFTFIFVPIASTRAILAESTIGAK